MQKRQLGRAMFYASGGGVWLHPSGLAFEYFAFAASGRAVDSAFGILLSGVEDDDIQEYFIYGPKQGDLRAG
jgi:hypothetical protein